MNEEESGFTTVKWESDDLDGLMTSVEKIHNNFSCSVLGFTAESLARGAPVEVLDLDHDHSFPGIKYVATAHDNLNELQFNHTLMQWKEKESTINQEMHDAHPSLKSNRHSDTFASVTASRKRPRVDFAHRDTNSFDDVKKAVCPSERVGPDSKQMKVLDRILQYFQNTCQDQQLLELIFKRVEECKVEHYRGRRKFRHLPGAIFDELVSAIGGDEFRRLVKKSQVFPAPQHQEQNHREFSSNVSIDCAMAEYLVAYGIYLGCTEKAKKLLTSGKSLDQILKGSVQVVHRMGDYEREILKTCLIKSPLLANIRHDVC